MDKGKKNPAAVALGRKGGKKGGPARAANMTPAQRTESARNAVVARWKRVKEQKITISVEEKCYPCGDESPTGTGESNA